MNAWNEVKVFAKAKKGTFFASANRRGLKIDPRRAEMKREVSRAYIQATQCNR